MMYEGMRDHYGLDVENFKVHAYAEADHGDAADYLLRQVAITGRPAAPHPHRHHPRLHPRNARAEALNRWLDDPAPSAADLGRRRDQLSSTHRYSRTNV